jgi:uncharacterized membrane protein
MNPVPTSEPTDSVAQATAHIRAVHKEETSTPQKLVDRFTTLIGQPSFIMVLAGLLLAWISGNVAATHLGYRALDPPPFFWLQGTITMGTWFVASLILTTQRREDQLTSHRMQLILELIISNDQKCSKVIELLEESRRDNPVMANRVDDQAVAMSEPSDALAVLKAIKARAFSDQVA